VRQIDRRVRNRLVHLVEDEPAYRALHDLPWLGLRPTADDDDQEVVA
jgi:hypothetical protein